MAATHQRVIALILAVTFFVTSAGVGAMVIWQIVQDSKEDKTVDQQDATTSGATLQGTKLQDFTPVEQVDSLQTIDTQVGTGDEVKAGDTVTVDYTGAVAATGVIFQSSLDTGQPVSFPLNDVIAGWKEGIPGMKAGGKRRLVIPAEKAYGGTPPEGSGIPANAPLVFDVTLHKIGQ